MNRFDKKLCAIVSGFWVLSAAQLAHSQQEQPGLEEIVVRGTALNYQLSINGKRDADGIVDQFSADEFGRLPDKNIGETLNRIPGVSMLLEKGEGRFVQIRGVSPRLNNVTINGVSMGSPESDDGGRLAPMDVIGGELLSGVQVIKTQTPDMDAQGIGGTLNLNTKGPFDYNQDFTAYATARFGYDEIVSSSRFDTGENPVSFDGTLAGITDTGSGRLGWLLGASYSDREYLALGIFQDDWRSETSNGIEAAYPQNVKNNYYIIGRERTNVSAALEFELSDTTRFYARSFISNWDEFQHRNRFEQGLSDNLVSASDAFSGTADGNRVNVNLRLENAEKELQSFTFGGETERDSWLFEYFIQSNANSLDEPNDNWEFRSGASAFGPDAFSVAGDGVVDIVPGGASPQSVAEQGFRRVRFQERGTDEDAIIAGLDATFDFGSSYLDEGYMKVGAKFTSTDRENDYSRSRYDEGDDWTLDIDPSLSNGGFTNEVPIRNRPNIWLNIDALNEFFANSANASLFEFNEGSTFNDQFQSDYTLTEDVAAAYVMAKVDFGRSSLVGGVRVEETSVDSTGFLISDENGVDVATPISRSGSYSNVLPSLIYSHELRDDLILRAAWTNTLGRPEYDAIAPRSVIDTFDDPTIGTIGTLNIGNPDLEARESSNLDFSLEWYFDEGSLLSLAVFAKDIENEIVSAPEQVFDNFTFEGTTYDQFRISTTTNASSAKLDGVELTFVNQFTSLPAPWDGFGVAAALTLMDSEFTFERNGQLETLPLLEQPDESTTLTLFYQKGPLDVAVTWNENASFLTDLESTRSLDLDQGEYARLDMRVQYNLRDNIKLFFEAQNINDEPTTEFQGGDPRRNTEYEYVGSSYFLGSTFQF